MYFHVRYGYWNLHFLALRDAWNVFVSLPHLLNTPFFSRLYIHPYAVVDFGISMFIVLLVLAVPLGWRCFKEFREGSPNSALLLCLFVFSIGLWLENVVGRASTEYMGLARYALPILTLLLIVGFAGKKEKLRPVSWYYVACVVVYGFRLQSALINRWIKNQFIG